MSIANHYTFRRRLADELTRDVLGPSEPHEVIHDAPITRYVTGVLYPQDAASIGAEHDVDDVDEDDLAGADPPVALANVRYPASMGITFSVATSTTETIRVQVEAARYAPFEEDEGWATHDMPTGNDAEGDRRKIVWRRVPLDVKPLDITVSRPVAGQRSEVADGLDLYSAGAPRRCRRTCICDIGAAQQKICATRRTGR